MTEATQEKVLSQVGEAVRELYATIDKIEAVLDTLEKQLEPILNTSRITSTSEGDTKEKEIVPLASDLRKGCRSLQVIFAKLSGMSDKVEL